MTGVIKHPTMTEKAMDDLDFQNKLQFVVDGSANKSEIADAVSEQFDVTVVDVTTAREVNAEDLAPGGEAGRLTVWTESAVEEVADR